jgi:predicted glycoside hydrolase/deacetylase ChbG (UPF0249 family)
VKTTAKYLIVNADDFGQSAGINRGIIAAHEQGIVTSASLMVRWPAAQEAADYARRHAELSVGLHLDLGEWICTEGEWQPLYEVIDTNDEIAVRDEVARQLGAFRSLVGKNPSHIDSHQHTHLKEPARSIVARIANELGCPLRSCTEEITYVGRFYGQTADGTTLPELISVEGLITLLRELPEGICELGCHPGFAEDLNTMYRDERAQEVAVLCDPEIKSAVADRGIDLISFTELPVIA